MKRIFAILPLVAALLFGCRPTAEISIDDFTETLYKPRHASGFEILGRPDGKSTLIRITDPWQGAEGIGRSLLIDRDGDIETAATPELQRIEGDARRIVCMSSSYIAMLSAIGRTDCVVGVSGIDFISDPHIAAARDKVGDVGYDSNIDYELLTALRPDLVLVYGIAASSGMETKLLELNIPYLYIGEYIEQSPLGKAEWLVALAEGVGCRDKGESAFRPIEERYEALKKRVAETVLDAPSAMLNTPYGDSWFMAPSGSCMARLIADAGGHYIYTANDTNSSLPIDLEQAAVLTSQADMWLNAQVATLADLERRFPKFADARCVRNGYVYNCDRRADPAGGNDFWESGVVRPDLVLRDLVKIFHPELVDEEFVYYRKIE